MKQLLFILWGILMVSCKKETVKNPVIKNETTVVYPFVG
jgi:hypothetical protein